MLDKLLNRDTKMAVVGMGYVGLPLALEFSKSLDVIGFDISENLIATLSSGHDPKGETPDEDFQDRHISFTTNEVELAKASVFIVAVPTPITKLKSPDLRPLRSASVSIGKQMSKGALVIYESTVYPGCTEEDCIPILERESGLKHLVDFSVGYSPERINPGDKVHTLTNTVKICLLYTSPSPRDS